MKILGCVLLVAVSFLLGWLLQPFFSTRDKVTVTVYRDTTFIKVDTVFQEKPVPVSTTIVDTVYLAVSVTDTVTNTATVPLERVQNVYQDSTYRLAVSGILPSLDWIEVYNKTVTRDLYHEVQVPDSRKSCLSISLSGVLCSGSSFSSASIDYSFRMNRLVVGASAGWDLSSNKPVLGISASLPLFRW